MSSPVDHQAAATAKALNGLEVMLLDETADPSQEPLPLSLLEAITSGFSQDRIIGRGGFAVVYKGILGNGTAVAVKRLSMVGYIDVDKYKQEIDSVMKAKHKNIVRFLGYCAEAHGKYVPSFDGKSSIMADALKNLLCFEYMSKGSLQRYITGRPCNLEWRKCYQIIKGICQGLHYLHENNILHLDLKPDNVLLDDCMVPKIADFGLSRCFEENQTIEFTSRIQGTMGYMAPETFDGKITIKSDIYSLGIIIINILTGMRGYPDDDDVNAVLESWRARLVEDAQFEQIRLCIDIAFECCNPKPAKRPVTQTIIERLRETEPADEVFGFDVRPRVLYFPCAPVTLLPSSLYLTNNTDEYVAFRLVENPKKLVACCFENLPLYGIVAPRSTYSLVVRTDKPREEYIDLILESCTLGDAQMREIQSNDSMLSRFFEEAENVDNMVQKVVLKAVATPKQELTPPEMEILRVKKTGGDEATCFDVNPTKEWMITGHKKGFVRIWTYQTKRKVHSFKVSYETVNSVKFLVRKKWFVVASDDGFIHVYNYETKMYRITSFRGGSIVAIHPSKPYMLSASYSHHRGRRVIGAELWDWDKNWERTKIFEIRHGDWPSQVAFNPMDTNTFAIAFWEHKVVEVRTIDRPRSPMYTLCGHTGGVNCLDFFKLDDQQYLITGSNDCSAKIWDMQKYVCVHTLKVSWFPIISVLFHPNRQVLITGSKDGTVYLWNSANFRLERIMNTGTYPDRELWGLAYFMNSIGILIFGGQITNTMIEESSNSSDMGPGDTTTDQTIPRDSELLDVHPLVIRFPSPGSTVQMVHLTNKTDERVAFRLLKNEGDSSYDHYAIIPSSCSYTLVLKAEWLRFVERTNFDLLLQSIMSGDKCMVPLQNISQCNELFEELRETGNTVYEAPLSAVLYPQGEVVTNKILSHPMGFSSAILDTHPTETWILKVSGQRVAIVDVVTEDVISDFKLDKTSVECGKFIGRMQWLLVGTYNGFIHVYTYETREIEMVTSFQASTASIRLMVIHPTQPYVLSSSEDREMKLWKWDVNGRDWKCAQTYDDEHPNAICQVTFNPRDAKRFASASRDRTIKVWSLFSPRANYTLYGHSAVTCLDFFTRGDKQYLVSGSEDGFVRIWDLEIRACVHTTELISPVRSVKSLPDRAYLLIGFQDCTVHLWSSARFSSERIFHFGVCGNSDCSSVHLLRSQRFVTHQGDLVSVVDINNVVETSSN